MDVSTVVIDNGGYIIRAGMGGELVPKLNVRSAVGRPKAQNADASTNPQKDIYIGQELIDNISTLNVKSPISGRVIQQFDDMEEIWQYTFDSLKIKPSEHPILITESPQNPKSLREQTIQVMMETFSVPGFYTTHPALLSLINEGKTSGLVVDSGLSLTHVVPIFESYKMSHLMSTLDIAGSQIDLMVKKLMTQSGFTFQHATEKAVIKEVKEKACYISEDFEKERQQSDISNKPGKPLKFADGTEIAVGSQSFKGPEVLFQPAMAESQSQGLHQLVANSIIGCDEDLIRTMANNIILSGGTTLLPGLSSRLKIELEKILPEGVKPRIYTPDNRSDSPWIGGSKLVSLAIFSQMWVTKADYEENGAQIVNLRCF